MEQTNYIKHLNNAFLKIEQDNRLNPSHVSLYMALFKIWNCNRFVEVFYIYRDEVMQFSKIGSKSTYHKCIKELSAWNYIIYLPSHNPYKGSQVKLTNFGTSAGQVVYPNSTNIETSTGQALVSNTNIYKQKENIYKLDQPKNENEVIDFFKKENWPILEAKKFYNHYLGIGWRVGGKTKIVNWHATANNWMLKSEEIKNTLKTNNRHNHNQDNLKIAKDKNYNQPL
ncbi:MAG: hypothetical protein HRT69_01840 [Flavobacteriaceae bacterium]|nr:hypothetical protein [Flavobacteriaceae bacterium]